MKKGEDCGIVGISMKQKIKISNKLVGADEPVFVIAEAGVNHNGKLSLALNLVEAAKKAGADAVKFQTFKTEDLVTKNVQIAEYQKANIGKDDSQFNVLKKLELTENEFKQLKEYCDQQQIIFLSTPHTMEAVDLLEPLVPAFKIPSGEITNLPFLEKAAQKQKPIILSTGMANLKEVGEAVEIIKKAGNKQIILLHCTTDYPCALDKVNLRAMQTMADKFNLPVGYSDHTLSLTVPSSAVALGAVVIEKHFTLDKTMPGLDHKASLEPEEFKKMVKSIRQTEVVLGSPNKQPTASEQKIKKLVRKSIVAKTDIKKGAKITKEMLAIKRPGTGLAPKEMDKALGKKATKDIKQDELIQLADLA